MNHMNTHKYLCRRHIALNTFLQNGAKIICKILQQILLFKKTWIFSKLEFQDQLLQWQNIILTWQQYFMSKMWRIIYKIGMWKNMHVRDAPMSPWTGFTILINMESHLGQILNHAWLLWPMNLLI